MDVCLLNVLYYYPRYRRIIISNADTELINFAFIHLSVTIRGQIKTESFDAF